MTPKRSLTHLLKLVPSAKGNNGLENAVGQDLADIGADFRDLATMVEELVSLKMRLVWPKT